MNLQRIIDRVYGHTLPIDGGMGESIDDAIVLQASAKSKYINLEYKVLDYLADLQCYKYVFVAQCLLKKGSKVFDKITVRIICVINGDECVKNYFFDITQCFKHQPLSLITGKY